MTREPTGPEGRPIGILAGGGSLPIELADRLAAAGRQVHIVAISGFADQDIERHSHQWIGLGQLGGMLRALKTAGCEELVILGWLRRPNLRQLRFDFGAVRHAMSILALTRGGDDGLLRVVVRFFEGQGFTVRGVSDLAPDMLAPKGLIAGPELDAARQRAIELARLAIEDLSAFDVGQAVVVNPEGIAAFEDADGTARLLSRIVERGGAPSGSVLAKLAKSGQELRIDMPTIGPRTIAEVDAAGIHAIAVGAGTTLLADRLFLRDAAQAAGVTVAGIGLADDGLVGDGSGTTRKPQPEIDDDASTGVRLAAVVRRHAAASSGDAAVVVRRGHVLVIETGALERCYVLNRLVTLPRGWGVPLGPRRSGCLVLSFSDESRPAPSAALASDLVAAAERARLSEIVIVREPADRGSGLNAEWVDWIARLSDAGRTAGVRVSSRPSRCEEASA